MAPPRRTVPIEISKKNLAAYDVLRNLLLEGVSKEVVDQSSSSSSSSSSSPLQALSPSLSPSSSPPSSFPPLSSSSCCFHPALSSPPSLPTITTTITTTTIGGNQEEGAGKEEEEEREEEEQPVLEAVDLLLSKLAARSSGVGSWYWPLGSTIVWNDENYQLFEKTREEFTGDWKEFESFVCAEDRNSVKQWLEDLFQRLIPIQEPTVVPMGPRLTFRIYRKDGSLRWVECKGQCYVEGPGKYHLVGVNGDITQQMELDNQRIQIETLQARVAEQTRFRRDLIQFMDSIAHELRNPMHGVLGNLEIMEELNLQIQSISARLRLLDSSFSSFSSTYVASAPALLSVISPPFPSSPSSFASVEISNCVSELESIFGSAAESLSALRECVRHQKAVLDDSLLLSKLDSVKVELKQEWCCFFDIGLALIRMYRHSSLFSSVDGREGGGKRDVQLRLVFEDEDGEPIQYDSLSLSSAAEFRRQFSVWADSTQLKTILSNLISNALKFTEKGSVVLSIRHLGRIRGRSSSCFSSGSESEVEEGEGGQKEEREEEKEALLTKFMFSVQDTGCGIDPDFVPLLFERFRQLPNVAQNYGGSGLGLCICDRIVKLFDPSASIQVQSKKGGGSCFSFSLSFASSPPASPPSSLSSQDSSSPGSATAPTSPSCPASFSSPPCLTEEVVVTTTTTTELGEEATTITTTTTTQTNLVPTHLGIAPSCPCTISSSASVSASAPTTPSVISPSSTTDVLISSLALVSPATSPCSSSSSSLSSSLSSLAIPTCSTLSDQESNYASGFHYHRSLSDDRYLTYSHSQPSQASENSHFHRSHSVPSFVDSSQVATPSPLPLRTSIIRPSTLTPTSSTSSTTKKKSHHRHHLPTVPFQPSIPISIDVSPSLVTSSRITSQPSTHNLYLRKVPIIDPLPVSIVHDSNDSGLRVVTHPPLTSTSTSPSASSSSTSASSVYALTLGNGTTLTEGKPKAVICEDNIINARMLQRFCQQKGFDTVILQDGKVAIEFFEALLASPSTSVSSASPPAKLTFQVKYEDICVVFLDILMPFFSGFDVAKRVRELEREYFPPSACSSVEKGNAASSTSSLISAPRPRLSIIGLSGHGRPEHRAEALAAGFDELLSKPVPRQVIIEQLTKCTLPPPLPPVFRTTPKSIVEK